MTRAFRCGSAGISTQDQLRSAGWMIGASIALTAVSLLLKLQLGPNAFRGFAVLVLSCGPDALERMHGAEALLAGRAHRDVRRWRAAHHPDDLGGRGDGQFDLIALGQAGRGGKVRRAHQVTPSAG